MLFAISDVAVTVARFTLRSPFAVSLLLLHFLLLTNNVGGGASQQTEPSSSSSGPSILNQSPSLSLESSSTPNNNSTDSTEATPTATPTAISIDATLPPDSNFEYSTCYCDPGTPLCNSTTGQCTTDTTGLGCMTKVRRAPSGTLDLVQQVCDAHIFSRCLHGYSGEGFHSFCCNGDFCNGCPDLAVLNVTLEELIAFNHTFSPECDYSTSSSSDTASATPTTSTATENDTSIVTTRGDGALAPLWVVPIVVVLAIILLLVLLLAIFVCYYISSRRCRSDDIESIGPPSVENLYDMTTTGISMSGCSGAGANTRVEMLTFSKMVILKERIAKGGFGYVWRGEWDGKDYAVKIFPSTLYKSWEREGEIYKTCMIAHDNILQFLCMDLDDRSSIGIQYWLVFAYHHNGSLSSYLRESTLTQNEALRFLTSITSGLAYLHLPIRTATTYRKPVLAHRDLKPSNILIKDNATCCIGDLGLAVTESDFTEGKEVPDHRQGTSRYLAPEILKGTIKVGEIASYVKADVYSLALIMWEVCRRCEWSDWSGEVASHEIPYSNLVPSDPSLEQMRKVVVTDKVRPPLNPTWKNDEMLCEVSRLINECWREIPAGRLTSMRIKKNLEDIMLNRKQEAFTSNE